MSEDFYTQNTMADDAFSDEPQTTLPSQIGPYKIESLLNQGALSQLYLGLHPETHEPIVVKALSQAFLTSPEMNERLLQEAKIIGLASHPNIVKLYGQGQWEGGLYIAMEFIQGLPLRQLILQNTLSLKRALELSLQIGYALAHLHAHGIIHRDLKPENIIMTNKGGIKIIDFGISQLHNDTTSEKNRNRLIGTPSYMSPEIKKDSMAVSFQSDIYALGLITYELVLGKPCHGTIHLSLMPLGLQKIIAKTLQPDPKERYLDVVDFISDLSAYLKSEDFEEQTQGKDFSSHLFEQLKKAAAHLSPAYLPAWPQIELGIAQNPLNIPSALYCDYFELSDGRFAILMAEPSSKEVDGILAIATLRGMIRSLYHTLNRPSEAIQKINQLIIDDRWDQFFILSLLLLDPKKNSLQYLSCGVGPLWHIAAGGDKMRNLAADNIALGIDKEAHFEEITANWNVGDTLIMHTFKAIKKIQTEGSNLTNDYHSDLFQQSLKEILFLTPQKQADALLRKVATQIPTQATDRPLMILSLHRIN